MRLARGNIALAALVAAGGCFVPRELGLRDAAPSESVEDAATLDADAAETPALDALSEPRADARDAMDATDAMDAMDARDVMGAMDAMDAADAMDAMDASDALDAREAFSFDIVRRDTVIVDVAPACDATGTPPEAGPPFRPPVACERLDYGMCGDTCTRTEEDVRLCGPRCRACGDRPCVVGQCCDEHEAHTCPVPDAGEPPLPSTADTRWYVDRNNCGACGVRCGDRENCACGTCACMAPFTRCMGACVDAQTSARFCGGCDVRCRADEACVAGSCQPRPLHPQSCSELGPAEPGTYTLYFENDCRQPYTAYCDDLDTGATTWLDVAQSDAFGERNYSFSRFGDLRTTPSGMSAMGRGLTTFFQRVRFEPENARIATWDARFSTSTGWDFPNVVLLHQQFGVASECKTDSGEGAEINVDLTGLPFAIVSRWTAEGYNATGGETARLLLDGTLAAPPTREQSAMPAVAVTASAKGRCGGIYPDSIDYSYRPMYIRVAYRR